MSLDGKAHDLHALDLGLIIGTTEEEKEEGFQNSTCIIQSDPKFRMWF